MPTKASCKEPHQQPGGCLHTSIAAALHFIKYRKGYIYETDHQDQQSRRAVREDVSRTERSLLRRRIA